jgi:hypothetical protein
LLAPGGQCAAADGEGVLELSHQLRRQSVVDKLGLGEDRSEESLLGKQGQTKFWGKEYGFTSNYSSPFFLLFFSYFYFLFFPFFFFLSCLFTLW